MRDVFASLARSRSRFLAIPTVIALLLTITAAGTSSPVSAASANGTIQAGLMTVEFSAALNARMAADVLVSAGASVVNLQHSVEVRGRTWSGGVHVLGERTPAGIATAFISNLHATIADQLSSSASTAAQRGADAALAEMRASLQASSARVRQDIVVRAVVIADAAARAKLEADSRVSAIRPVAKSKDGPRSAGRPMGLAAPLSSDVSRENWVPDNVYVTFQPSSLGGRYVSQDIIWNAGRTLNFANRHGYEAKLFLYNYTYTTYLTTGTWYPSGIPQVSAWNSNFPGNYYLDTRAGDPKDCDFCEYKEVAYTIGVNGNDGWRIAAGTWYNTYIRTGNGSSSTGQAKMTPSYTSCSGTTCDTWEMFQHDLCPANYQYGPFWNTPAPVWSWYWNRFNGGGNGAQPGCY